MIQYARSIAICARQHVSCDFSVPQCPPLTPSAKAYESVALPSPRAEGVLEQRKGCACLMMLVAAARMSCLKALYFWITSTTTFAGRRVKVEASQARSFVQIQQRSAAMHINSLIDKIEKTRIFSSLLRPGQKQEIAQFRQQRQVVYMATCRIVPSTGISKFWLCRSYLDFEEYCVELAAVFPWTGRRHSGGSNLKSTQTAHASRKSGNDTRCFCQLLGRGKVRRR